MRATSAHFDELRSRLATQPLVDCHEHIIRRERSSDILSLISNYYLENDFASAVGDTGAAMIADTSLPFDTRWEVFERAWKACRSTSYGMSTRRGLARLFGTDEVTRENVEKWREKLPDFSSADQFDPWIKDARIAASISDNFMEPADVWGGSWEKLPWQHLAISLPSFHSITTREDLYKYERPADRCVTSLDEYIQLCGEYFERWVTIGAVAFKDQSAYTRSLAYELPARSDAERVFNAILADERYRTEYDPYSNPLSDYLFHEFLRLARDMHLPVQLHTGHMAGSRNDVAKANAAGLRSILEVHRDVRFDLFHGNWPYMGDLLFLAKNYENVAIDMCWATAIDPIYSKELLKRAVVTVPCTKIHAFGSDVGGTVPHMVWAYAELARDVIASALSELIDEEHLSTEEAVGIGRLWCDENPRAFFRLDDPPNGAT
jgi:predicted TIM-barrel fold metal-dependent hydrolase